MTIIAGAGHPRFHASSYKGCSPDWRAILEGAAWRERLGWMLAAWSRPARVARGSLVWRGGGLPPRRAQRHPNEPPSSARSARGARRFKASCDSGTNPIIEEIFARNDDPFPRRQNAHSAPYVEMPMLSQDLSPRAAWSLLGARRLGADAAKAPRAKRRSETADRACGSSPRWRRRYTGRQAASSGVFSTSSLSPTEAYTGRESHERATISLRTDLYRSCGFARRGHRRSSSTAEPSTNA